MDSNQVFQALNDVVIKRGEFKGCIKLDVFVNAHLVCTVTGDGVVISTPSGSMDYSMALGGSIIHTDIPCICMTPINPYSLSSRPLILPEYSNITIKMHPSCRGEPLVTIDGYPLSKLRMKEMLVIQMSDLDVPGSPYKKSLIFGF